VGGPGRRTRRPPHLVSERRDQRGRFPGAAKRAGDPRSARVRRRGVPHRALCQLFPELASHT
jgi:hypothetical protein